MSATRNTETFFPDLQIDLIRASSTNPRQHFDPAGLDELKRSIEQLGIQEPLLVREIELGGGYVPAGEEEDDEISGRFSIRGYEVISGHRRLRAAVELGLATVPAIVREFTDEEAADAAIVANLQRVDIHPVEEAEAYRALIAAGGDHIVTAEDIAKRVGKPTAHVAKMLKLLTLELDAKLLFSRGHLTLGHVQMLAVLTPVDQERALRFMLDSDPKYDKSTITELIRSRLRDRDAAPADEVEGDEGDESEDEQLADLGYREPSPKVVKYMHHGRRVIDATEAQLKRWIESNVLLRLVNAPFSLHDGDLVKLAGACVDCPKRSGSNAALFSDFTAEEDVCLDPVCYAAKQKAYIAWEQSTAKKQGKPLAKLSSKRGEEKLPELVTEKTVLKAGQWVLAEPGSCAAAVQGLMRDGADGGKVFTICANQKCKVHKHRVNDGGSSMSSSATSVRSPEDEAKREVKNKALVDSEIAIRAAVKAALLPKIGTGWKMLQIFMAMDIKRDQAWLCTALGLSFVSPKGAANWQLDSAAAPVLAKWIMSATQEQLVLLAFELMTGDPSAVDIDDVLYRLKYERSDLWTAAKYLGVDADAIAAKILKPVKVKAVTAKKAAAKPVAKKAAVKKTAAKKAVAPKKAAKTAKLKLTPEGRKRIADAMKKRFAGRRKAVAK